MKAHTSAIFEIKSWDEQPYDEFDGGRKMTRATVKKIFKGAIEGEGTLEYLMAYAEDGSASFVGMERIVGCLGKRTGSFVLQHTGTFRDGVAKAILSVVPGSATGELSGLRGEGCFELGHAKEHSFTLDYDFG